MKVSVKCTVASILVFSASKQSTPHTAQPELVILVHSHRTQFVVVQSPLTSGYWTNLMKSFLFRHNLHQPFISTQPEDPVLIIVHNLLEEILLLIHMSIQEYLSFRHFKDFRISVLIARLSNTHFVILERS